MLPEALHFGFRTTRAPGPDLRGQSQTSGPSLYPSGTHAEFHPSSRVCNKREVGPTGRFYQGSIRAESIRTAGASAGLCNSAVETSRYLRLRSEPSRCEIQKVQMQEG